MLLHSQLLARRLDGWILRHENFLASALLGLNWRLALCRLLLWSVVVIRLLLVRLLVAVKSLTGFQSFFACLDETGLVHVGRPVRSRAEDEDARVREDDEDAGTLQDVLTRRL
jgi:hypothetical protein